jgi:hypothetical protein
VKGFLDRHAAARLAMTKFSLWRVHLTTIHFTHNIAVRDMTKKIILAVAMACAAVWIVLLVRMLAANLAAG